MNHILSQQLCNKLLLFICAMKMIGKKNEVIRLNTIQHALTLIQFIWDKS